jgi:signal transduction histidine kinase
VSIKRASLDLASPAPTDVCAMSLPLPTALRRLADALFEVPDLGGLCRLLAESLPDLLGVSQAAVLVWNRRLDAFEGLIPGKTKLQPVESQPDGTVPETRYLLSDGALLDTGGERGEGTLLPLIARSGMIGMLVLGPRRRHRQPPFSARAVQLLTRFSARAAMAVESHVYQRELIESERTAALGTMASMLAHDFRGPMTVIRGYAETFLDPTVSVAEVRARAEVILQTIDRLDRMATETLDFARVGGQLARRPVDLGTALDLIIRATERELPGLTVVRDFAPLPATAVTLDVDKLQRAIGSIAANARDAMGGNGRLVIAARMEGDQVTPPMRLVLTLADEGPGVSAEIRETLFDPFVTAGKKRGTGLGLAVARRFVEDHDGTLTLLPPDAVEPGLPNGARLRIVLPLVAAAATLETDAHESAPPPSVESSFER